MLSQFDNFKENDIPVLERIADLPPQFKDTPQQKMSINNQTDVNKGKIKGYLILEDVFGFCKTFKKVTKILSFHLKLKTVELQDIISTSVADDINITIKNLYLYIAISIPSVETQIMFNEATQTNYRISYDEYYTKRRIISDIIVQVDLESAQQVISKYLISAHQTKYRIDTLTKNINIAIFDNLDLCKYYVEIDEKRFPRESVSINYTEKDYNEQFKDSNLLLKEFIGELMTNPFISYPDIKTEYSIVITGLRQQPDQITPKKRIFS